MGYCRWGDKDNDIWRYYWKLIKTPVIIENDPVNIVDICKLLGGTPENVQKSNGKITGTCKDFYDGTENRVTCPLEKMWNLTCKHSLIVPNAMKK